MENSRTLQAYYKDFEEWTKEMNAKDKMLTQMKSNEPKVAPIRSQSPPKPSPQPNPKLDKFKRDKNSIKDYYDNWDKVNADADLIDVDTGIIINSPTETAQSLYNDKRKSNPNQNIGVTITNTRNQFNNIGNSQVEKLKHEANANFAIKNFTKSIELYTTAIKLLNKEDKSELAISLYNNRGNCQIKLRNYKMAVQDFDFVLECDANNIKALYRRGISYCGIEKHYKGFMDLNKAYTMSETDKEKEMIKIEIDKAISSMNTLILKERAKMERFDYNDEDKFTKMNIIDIPSVDLLRDEDELMGNKKETNINNNNVNNTNTNKVNTNENVRPITNTQRKIAEQNKNIFKKEDINKFVYDITTEKLTASSFKYAFRNFGSDITAKRDYLLKIDPKFLQKIFKTDLDKDTLLDIFKCLKNVESHGQIIEYLKGIIKINRIKLIIQLVPRKNKVEMQELFDMLEKGDYSSEVIPIKDFFFN